MDFTLLALMVALGWKIVDTIKFLEMKDFVSFRRQVTAWVSGVAVVFLGAESDWAGSQEINGQLLADLNVASKVVAGMALLSVAGIVRDALPSSRTSE